MSNHDLNNHHIANPNAVLLAFGSALDITLTEQQQCTPGLFGICCLGSQ